MTSLILAGLGIAGAAFAGRMVLQAAKKANLQQQLPKILGEVESILSMKGYYKGGFEPKMTKREAALILGVSQSAPKQRINEAHRRIMILNHPDKGGSPYIAAKINEAKDMLSSTNK